MKQNEFHRLNREYFTRLNERGFKKLGSSSRWARDGENNIGIEFSVRFDKYGWLPKYGSSFMYEVLPRYKGKTVNYYLAKQLRLFELQKFDAELTAKAEIILNQVASKLPQHEGAEGDDLYTLLKSGWTQEKIVRYIGRWYYFYDESDLIDWHDANYPDLMQAIDEMQAKFENEDFKTKRTSRPKGGQEIEMRINANTGEIEMNNRARQ